MRLAAHGPAATARLLRGAPRLLVATDAHEGPVYVATEDALYFTTAPGPGTVPGFPRVAIMRLALGRTPAAGGLTTVRADANVANGMALATGGDALLVCEQGSRTRPARIARLSLRDRRVETVVDGWLGLRLNSPNDVVVKGDGTIWFTDPSYGHLQGFRPPPHTGDHVYRYDPASRRLSVVADTLDKPNGLAFSPDEATLYVADSGAVQEPGSFYRERPHQINAYDVVDGGRRLAGERVLAEIPGAGPDGLAVDAAGRVFSSAAGGIAVFAPDGAPIGEIAVPGAVNFTFGGPRRDVLLITADDAIWAAELTTPGSSS
jgi:gluconolactonase